MTVEEGLKMVVSGGIVTPGVDEADEETAAGEDSEIEEAAATADEKPAAVAASERGGA
jgi:uncharacterized membrane protein